MTAWERAGRPKPPPLSDVEATFEYEKEHGTVSVSRIALYDGSHVWAAGRFREYRAFYTRAYALTYAHKLAYERNTN